MQKTLIGDIQECVMSEALKTLAKPLLYNAEQQRSPDESSTKKKSSKARSKTHGWDDFDCLVVDSPEHRKGARARRAAQRRSPELRLTGLSLHCWLKGWLYKWLGKWLHFCENVKISFDPYSRFAGGIKTKGQTQPKQQVFLVLRTTYAT
jgi:hypothetical protein